jgi:hypothetical protein
MKLSIFIVNCNGRPFLIVTFRGFIKKETAFWTQNNFSNTKYFIIPMFKVRKNNKLEKNHVFEDALSFHNLFYGLEGGNALTSLNLCWNNLGSEEILHVDFSGS